MSDAIAHDFVPETEADMARCLADPMWRIGSGQLYKILAKSDDGEGQVIPFKPNRAQRRLIARLWHRNLILKARQLGYTTLIAILWLDHALFVPDQRCGIIAHDREAAEVIFRDKVRLAYDRLPEQIREAIPLVSANKSELMFANNSSIRVATSMRSGTIHRLHVSELGKIAAKFPDKAKEVQTGSLPAVPIDGITIIESTAEGQDGLLHDMATDAMALADTPGRILTPRQYRFHFAPWWQEPGYTLDDPVPMTEADAAYFAGVEAVMQTKLSPGQRAWYVATRDSEFGGDPELMWQEYPSTPREAFQTSEEGHYYAVQLAAARRAGRITVVPFMPGYPVNTFWDIGHTDGTAVWLHQRVGLLDRFFGFIEDWEKPYNHFTAELQRKSADLGGITWGTHHLPHDADHKRQLGTRITTPKEELENLKLGGKWEIVDRVDDLQHGIQLTRKAFANSAFDEIGCKKGLLHLAGYRKRWNRITSTWSDEPLKNEHTEGADAYRQYAQGYQAPIQQDREDRRERRRNQGSWKTA